MFHKSKQCQRWYEIITVNYQVSIFLPELLETCPENECIRLTKKKKNNNNNNKKDKTAKFDERQVWVAIVMSEKVALILLKLKWAQK